MKVLISLSTVVVIAILSGSALMAAEASAKEAIAAPTKSASPVGMWQIISDETHKATSEITIWKNGDVLSGRLSKIYDPNAINDICTACEGKLKGKPLVGLQILDGFKATENNAVWEGGTIVDPRKGSTYKCIITLKEGGKKLDVRGYIGFSWLGRTQTWLRLNKSK